MPSNTLSLSLPAASGSAVSRGTSARFRVGLNISAAPVFSFVSTASSSVGLTVIATRSLTYNVSASFSVGVTVAASTSGDTPATASLTMGVDVTATATTSFVATASSIVGVTMVATRSLTYNASASSTVGLTVSATVTYESSAGVLTASMTMGAMMIATRSLQFNPTASMSVGLTAAATRSLQFNPTASMSVGLTAAATRSLQFNPTASMSVGLTFAASDPLNLTPFSNSRSRYFDGTNDYLSVADADDLSFGDSADDSAFSVSMWVNFETSAYRRHITVKGVNTSSTDVEFLTGTTGGNKFFLGLYDAGTAHREVAQAEVALSMGTWYHWAATYDGSAGTDAYDGINLYINGSLVTKSNIGAGSYDSMHNAPTGLDMGAWRYGAAYFKGYLDEVSIWSKELTSGEVSSMYNSGTPTDLRLESGLVAYWRMEESTGTEIADSSPNSHTATINGAVTSTTIPS